MSNSQITSQLTRVTAPSIGDSNFAEGIRNAFETINNNFKNIASLPFIQGVQGDSYTLISKDIWVEVNDNVSPIYYALTKEGAVLLNSIFESHLKNTGIKFHEGDSFDECKTNKLGDLSLNGISPIDSFFTGENGSIKPVNNKLYFYSVINNLNEEQDTYLGQYFYFIDYRITELGNTYQSEKLSDFIDFTGFYQYQPASENEPEKYNAISIVPNLYYDKDKDDICWKYNGQETGISAIGPKGLDGKDANFEIVYVKNENATDNSGDILGYFDPEKEDIEYTSTLKNCFCLVQFVNTETNEDNTVKITSYVDSAFGEVHENKVYWQNSLKIGKLFNNQNITRYFCSMGNNSDGIENNPYYFAIPVYLERNEANTNNYKEGHVFSSSSDRKLVLQKANNAFTEEGGQVPLADLDIQGTQGEFNIKNYNVSINKDLGVSGTLGVTGAVTFRNNLTVSGTLGVTGTATVGSDLSVSGALGVTGAVTFKDYLTVSGTLGVGGAATFNNNVYIDGNLGVTGSATVGSDLSVKSALGVTGEATFNNNLSVGGTLGVTGNATIEGDLDITNGNLNVTNTANIGALNVTGNADISNGLFVSNGDLNVTNGGLTISDTLGVGGKATFNEISVDGEASFNKTVSVIGAPFGTTSNPGLIVEGGKGGSVSTESAGIGLIVRGGISDNGSTGLGIKVETGDVEISDNLSVSKQLVVNSGGINNSSGNSEIYGYNAYGETSEGGTGLIVYGGSGGKTGTTSHGNGGVGLVVKGGTAGIFTGAEEYAGSGGTGLVVYGGEGGLAGLIPTNKFGNAIQTYGAVVIGDTGGTYPTKISSNDKGLSINRSIRLNRIPYVGIISLNNMGDPAELNGYYDISTNSHISISYDLMSSDSLTNNTTGDYVGKCLISLYATGEQGTSEKYTVTIVNCPKNSIICFGVKIQNPPETNSDLDNVYIYVQSIGSNIKQYCGNMGVIPPGDTVYRGFVTYVV